MKELMEAGRAEFSSGEYFNRYKGTEYCLRLVVWRGEQYIVGYVRSYPDCCPSEGDTGYVVYPLARAVAELAHYRQLRRQGENLPPWSILQRAQYGEEAARLYWEAEDDITLSV